MDTNHITKGGRIMILCVFHSEKTPSLRIWPDGAFFCHGCHTKGHVNDRSYLAKVYNQAHSHDVPPESDEIKRS